MHSQSNIRVLERQVTGLRAASSDRVNSILPLTVSDVEAVAHTPSEMMLKVSFLHAATTPLYIRTHHHVFARIMYCVL